MKSFALGFVAGAIVTSAIAFALLRPAPSPIDPGLADSLRVAVDSAKVLEAEVKRLAEQDRADSIALAASSRRIRLDVDSSAQPADTVIDAAGDTVLVFRVPPQVASHVEKLTKRVASLERRVTAAELSAHLERKAKEFALRANADLERALQNEQRRKWRYRLEGAGVGGIVIALAGVVIAL